LLDKCGFLWERRRRLGEGGVMVQACKRWMTRRFAGAEPERRTAETYERLAAQYSVYSKFASHFVILRKRRRSAMARQKPRPLARAQP
jgi:hypothetical protein